MSNPNNQTVQRAVNPASLSAYLSEKPKTIALFILSRCPFCRAFRPALESFARKNSAGYAFLEVVLDDEDNPLWEQYGIEVVPTMIVFDGDKIVNRKDGRAGEGLSESDLINL